MADGEQTDRDASEADPLDPGAIQAGLVELVGVALRAVTTPEELVDCAHAVAALGDRGLLEQAGARIGREVELALRTSSAWEAELAYNKLDAWAHTGHKARLLAEAWGVVQAGLASTATPKARATKSARRSGPKAT